MCKALQLLLPTAALDGFHVILSPVCDPVNRSQLRRTVCSLLGQSFSSTSMKWAVTPKKPRMLLSVQMSTVTDTLSVFCSLHFILDSFSATSSLRRLVTVLRLTGQYLSSTTDIKFLKLGLSIKDRGRLHEMMRSCITDSVMAFCLGCPWLYSCTPLVWLKNESMLLCPCALAPFFALLNSLNLKMSSMNMKRQQVRCLSYS